MFPLKELNIRNVLQMVKRRQLWTYVAIAFNKVDYDRLKEVGPDRLCAEWVLKNGGAVSFVEAKGLLRDYNLLPPISTKLRLHEIDATKSSIMKLGLEHLKGCDHVESIIFHSCKHIERDGLQGLPHVKNTLKNLQVSACYNIDDDGLMVLKEMTKLKNLRMFDMRTVKNLNNVVSQLQPHLAGCIIDTEECLRS